MADSSIIIIALEFVFQIEKSYEKWKRVWAPCSKYIFYHFFWIKFYEKLKNFSNMTILARLQSFPSKLFNKISESEKNLLTIFPF